MLLKDLVYALRTLRKSPVFAVTAVLTIALGMGASTAIFSVANAVLLRPLPYANPDRLVFAITDMQKRNVKDFPFSNANYIDLRNGTTRMFDQIAAVNTGRATVPGRDGTPEQIRFGTATPNFFGMMGAKIAVGRDFTQSDGEPQPTPAGAAPGAQAGQRLPGMVILSYQYWQRRFGGDTAILGQPLPGQRQVATQIVGVLAPGFELLFPTESNLERVPDVWFAARIAYDNANRNNVQWRLIGRLKDGVTLEQAQSAANLVSAELRKNFVIMATAGLYIRLEPMHRHVVEEVRPALIALFGAVIFLLLISCANVANLLLVRSSLRERELAVRTAMGASGWRLAKQILVEAVLLAGLGTAVGMGLAWFGIHELLAIAPANLPRIDSIRIDPVVLGFAALAGLLAAGIFGMFPAWRASRSDVNHILRGSGRMASLGGGRLFRNGVVVVEVALSFVLLIGCGLMVRSFIALQRIDPGFDPHRMLTFGLLGGRPGPQPAPQRAAMQRNIQSQLRAIPGVESVTAAFPFPLAGGFSPIRWGLEPALTDPTKFQAADFQIVLPGYFETMRTRLIAGRTFTEADSDPERKVVIIDQFLAAKAFPNESAVGKRILQRTLTPEPTWVEVIGVVGHQRESSLAEPGREQIYYTDGFFGHGAAGTWALRTSGDPAKYGGAVREAIAKIGGQFVIIEMQPMEALVEKAQAGTRFQFLLIGVFAVIAAFLAAVGLYGVLSTVVRQRTAEIGVRMAFGAEPVNIFKLMVGHGMSLSALGIGVGLIAALALTRLMVSMLVGVQATDPVTFAAIVLLFFVIAGVASWLPARRAAGLDPTVALREE